MRHFSMSNKTKELLNNTSALEMNKTIVLLPDLIINMNKQLDKTAFTGYN